VTHNRLQTGRGSQPPGPALGSSSKPEAAAPEADDIAASNRGQLEGHPNLAIDQSTQELLGSDAAAEPGGTLARLYFGERLARRCIRRPRTLSN